MVDKIWRKLTLGTLTIQDLYDAVFEYRLEEKKIQDILNNLPPEVQNHLMDKLHYKFTNGESFTLREWEEWKKEGWKKVFSELEKRAK